MQKDRITKICAAIFISFLLLISRLAYLQLFQGERLAGAASSQRMGNSELEKPRGDILDRNGIMLTHRSKVSSVIIMPLFFRGREDNTNTVCEILGLDFEKTQKKIEVTREPIIIEADKNKLGRLLKENIEGISVLHSLKRYDNNTVAKHILGYLNKSDQVGEAGLEKFYEKVLKLESEKTFSVVTDARSNLIKGLGYRVIKDANKDEKLNLRLTLDYHIQKIVEDVMEQNQLRGAVVVEDVYSGDILAMASKPDFNPSNVSSYLQSNNNELFNRAVASYNLGSIFKIIDAACILESKKNYNSLFECTGSITLGNKEFRCSAPGGQGHGWLDFDDAFAKSCNPYFINLGVKLGPEKLLNTAEKFGMGSVTGVKDQGVDESAGKIPENIEQFLEGDTANISIGQGNIMATPLQVANIVATVANGGVRNAPCIVDCIVDADGNRVRDIRRKEGERVITKETSRILKRMMEKVTEEGTGEKARIESYGGSGGKTGSAETGQYIDGEKVVHAWFAGYFPRKTPRYSICIFIENGKTGGTNAAPVFSEIASEIAKKGL